MMVVPLSSFASPPAILDRTLRASPPYPIMVEPTRSPAPRRAARPGASGLQSTTPKADAPIKLLLVDFRSGESVCQHPDVKPMLSDGWSIRSAVPRLVEDEGTKLLVVLTRRKTGVGRPLSLAATHTADDQVPVRVTSK